MLLGSERTLRTLPLLLLVAATGTAHAGDENIRPAPDFPEDPGVLSPPVVVKPLYACATAVTVSGFVPDADVHVFVNGVEENRFRGTDPNGQPASVPALVAGDVVTATQEFGGVVSDPSAPVVVKNYLDDYPNGPPQPTLHAPLYECGISTAVRNLVAGSTVSVYSETQTSPGTFDPEVVVGTAPNAGASGQGVRINPPFIRDARVTADYQICKDISSRSPPEFVQPEPSTIPAVTLDPVVVGQATVIVRNCLNGARVQVFSGSTLLGSTGGSSNGNVVGLSRAVIQGEVLTATQELCSGPGPSTTTTVSDCSALTAPLIRHPEVGDTSIEVLQANPGARILVYDGTGRQIGDGGGATVVLTRRLTANDEVWVLQHIGTCTSQTAYFVPVTCKTIDEVSGPQANPAFGVGSADYELPAQQIGTRNVRMIGHVVFPTDANSKEQLAPFGGPFPLVIILHGRHGVTRTSDGDVCEGVLEGPFNNEVQSHLGYRYWQRELARLGVVSVSISANDLACENGDGPFIDERAELIVRHLEQWQAFVDPNSSDPSFNGMFHGRLDLQRVAFAGHSRGGEAAVVALRLSQRTTSVVRSVVSVAPTDVRRTVLQDTPLLMILPAADGDVFTNSGAAIYDRAGGKAGGKWFKSQQYIYGANHNFFNREWAFDDGSGPNRLGRSDQERFLVGWGDALVADTLLGENHRPVLAGDEVLTGLPAVTVLPSYQHEGAEVFDHYDDANGVTRNSFGFQVTRQGSSWINFSEERLAGNIASASTTWRQSTFGLLAQWSDGNDAAFVSDLVATDVTPFEYLSFRGSQTFHRSNVPTRTYGDLAFALRDVSGVAASVPLGSVGTLPFPYENPMDEKAMLHTIRIPLKCFLPEREEMRFDALKEFEFSARATAENEGSVALDQFEFTH